MKNAIAYIARAAKVEQEEGGLRASFDFYANIERLAKAEKNKALADAIKAGLAEKVDTGKVSYRVPAKDDLIQAIGYTLWEKVKKPFVQTITVWHSDK